MNAGPSGTKSREREPDVYKRQLYDAAFIYYYYLKDVSKAERYLTAYLKTRPKGIRLVGVLKCHLVAVRKPHR